MDDTELFEQFYNNLRLGISGVESGGGDNYSAQNKQSSAAGKYQFTKQWLNEKKFGKNSITAFARNSGVFKVPKDMEEFKADGDLQEAFFKHYAQNVLYPNAKKAVAGKNPLGLSIGEVGAIFHFQPPGDAKRMIESGKLKEATKIGVDGASSDNMSVAGYLDVFNRTIEKSGGKKIDKSVTSPEKDQVKVKEDFAKRYEAIDALEVGDDPQRFREKKRAELFQEFSNNGNAEIANKYIDEVNAKNRTEFDAARNLETVLNGAEKSSYDITNSISFEFDSKNPGDVSKAMKDFPELFKGASIYDTNKKIYNPWKLALGAKGKKVSTVKFSQYQSNAFANKLFDLNQQGVIDVNEDQTLSNNIYGVIADLVPEALQSGATASSISTLVSSGEQRTFTPISRIDTKKFKPEPKIYEPTPPKKEGDKKEVATTEEEVPVKEVPDNTAKELYNQQLNLNATIGDDFGMGETKQSLPIDAITGLALGLVGNDMAKKAKIPLRTEEVSEAMRNYTAEMAKRSKEGLPVEMEAAMKAQLADAYQGGLANIVNASGGNRALVLGNQGQLEQAKNKGLVAIQIADYKAKEKAFEQYGQAIGYMNDFDSRREIANHGIKYKEAIGKREEGKQLATAGMAKLMESLAYQSENGPGSANDMYRSLLMQKMFGFDPKMKDDGSGKKGTKSAFDKGNLLLAKKGDVWKASEQTLGTLNPDQQMIMNKFAAVNQDVEKLDDMMAYLQKNPSVTSENISMDNLDVAIKNNDYSMLSLNRDEALNNSLTMPTEAETEQVKKAEGLTSIAASQSNSPEVQVEQKQNTGITLPGIVENTTIPTAQTTPTAPTKELSPMEQSIADSEAAYPKEPQDALYYNPNNKTYQ